MRKRVNLPDSLQFWGISFDYSRKNDYLCAKINTNNMITRSYSDKEIIDSYYNGIQEPFTWFYITSKPEFFDHFKIEAASDAGKVFENMRFRKDNSYIDDLFQESSERLLHKILDRKLFVEDDTIYVTRKNGSVEKLTTSLYNYMQGIGDFLLKTLIRDGIPFGSESFEDLKRKLKGGDYDEGPEEEGDPIQPLTDPLSGGDADADGEEPGEAGLNIFSFIDDEDDDGEPIWNIMRRATKEIVANMKEPCKTIFRLTYYQKDGKKMPDEQIAKEMGYSGSTVVKTTRNRCHNKFYKKLVEVLGVIKGYKRK